MIVSRLLQFWFFMPLKTPDGKYHKIEKKIWLMFILFEVIGVGITTTWSSYWGITTATGIVEICVLAGQFLYSNINVGIQESEEQEEGY